MKIWSRLADSTKKKYRAKGVTPQRYNAWVKTGKGTKEKLAAKGVTRDEFLKAKSTKDVQRRAAEQAAEKRMNAVLPRANPKTIRSGIDAMTGGELYIATKASPDKLRRLASRKPYRVHNGKDVNPFWYR